MSGCQHVKRTSNFEYPNIPPSILNYFKAALNILIQKGLGPDIQKDQVNPDGLKRFQYLYSLELCVLFPKKKKRRKLKFPTYSFYFC